MSAGARAQEQGASVSGNVSAINIDSHTSVAYTGAFDYRFTNVVGLELELTYAPSLEPRFAGSIIPPLPASSSIIGLAIPPSDLHQWDRDARSSSPTTFA